jgi:hypothetical protein
MGSPLTPRLYGATELGVLSITAPGEAHPRVLYVGGELFVGLSRPDGAAITQGEVEGWAEPFADVLADANGAAAPLPEPTDGVILVEDETLAAAVLTDPSSLAGMPLKGTAVVWALARTTLVISGSDDERGIAKVLELAESLYAAEGPLVSIHPVTLDGSQWAPYQWTAATEEQRLGIHRAIRLFGVRGYEAQTAALQRPDVHVADPKVHVREDGVTVTFATWPKGTATLLPVTDSVVVADPSGSISVAEFGEFLDAAGDLVVKTGLSPSRYFVRGVQPSS